MSFVHLNVKTGFSFLEGALPLEQLCDRVKALGMDAVAVTDEDYGAYEFYKRAKNQALTDLGSELQLLPEERRSMIARPADTYALTVLAQRAGWRNLKEPSPKPPFRATITCRGSTGRRSEHAEGLIVLSGGLGRSSRAWHGWRDAVETASSSKRFGKLLPQLKLAALFEPGDFYLEFQDTGLPEEPAYNEFLLSLVNELGLPGVATNNCHYLDQDDAEAHRYLMCIQYRTTIDKFDGPEVSGRYLKDDESMRRGWFADHPELLEASGQIAQRCAVSMGSASITCRRFPAPTAETRRRSYATARSKAKRFVNRGDRRLRL